MRYGRPYPTYRRTAASGNSGRPYRRRTWLVLAVMAGKLSARVPSKSNRAARIGMPFSPGPGGAGGVSPPSNNLGGLTPPARPGYAMRMADTPETAAPAPAAAPPPTAEQVFRDYAPRIYQLAR